MTRHLPRPRFRPLIATFRFDPAFPALDNLGAPLHVLPLRRTYDFNALRVARSLRSLIRAEGVRITHCFFETADLWGGLIARLSGCPVLISSRRDMGIQRNWKHHLAYRVLGHMFDQVQTVSEEVRRSTLVKDRMPADRVVTVYNDVEQETTARPVSPAELRAKLGLSGAAPIAITVANVRPVKGLEVLIRAAALVCRSRPDVTFLIVGDTRDGAYVESLQALAAQLGVAQRVRFWGPERAVADLLGAADMFVLLSHSEGFSNAVIEAMAAGLPCVVSDVGGNAEAVSHGENGYVVPRGDHSAAAEGILSLLNDVALRGRMGQIGSDIARERFTTEAMIRRLTASYEMLLDR